MQKFNEDGYGAFGDLVIPPRFLTCLAEKRPREKELTWIIIINNNKNNYKICFNFGDMQPFKTPNEHS